MKLFTRGTRVETFIVHIRNHLVYLVVPLFVLMDIIAILIKKRWKDHPPTIRNFYWGIAFALHLVSLPTEDRMCYEKIVFLKAQ